MRACSKCKIEKNLSEFSKDKHGKNGYRSCCKKCDSDSRKIYYLQNRDKKRLYGRKYYLEHSEKSKEYRKKWYEKNREIGKRDSRNWYAKNKERSKVNHTKWRETHKSERNKYLYKHKYGISVEERYSIWLNQNKKCKICQRDLIDSEHCHTDHNHVTGKIRGLLCNNCNLLLGQAHDNIEILRKAIKYLQDI